MCPGDSVALASELYVEFDKEKGESMQIIRSLVRLLPERCRSWLRERFGNSWFGILYTRHVVGIEEAYGSEFVRDLLSDQSRTELEAIADSLWSLFSPASVMDVGCGRRCENAVILPV